MQNRIYYTAKDVAEILGVSVGHAYKIIKCLNEELKEKNFYVVSGKVSIKYFQERFYGCTDNAQKEVNQ